MNCCFCSFTDDDAIVDPLPEANGFQHLRIQRDYSMGMYIYVYIIYGAKKSLKFNPLKP